MKLEARKKMESAFDNQLKETNEKIRTLQEELKKYQIEATIDGKHYGWTGSLEYVESLLNTAIAHLRNEDEE